MVDVIRSDSQILALLPDNATGQIEPQDERDMYQSLRDRDRFKLGQISPTAGALSLDISRANHWWIDLTANVTSVLFANRAPVNLAWPSEDITHAHVVKGTNTTVTANAGQDPNGGNTADRLVMPAGGSFNTFLDYPFYGYAGRIYQAGFYAKENGVGSLFNYAIRNAATNLFTIDAAPTSSWQLFSLFYTAAVSEPLFFEVNNRSTSSAVDMLVWGFQICPGDSGLPPYGPSQVSDSSGPAGEANFLRLYLKQDVVGSRTFAWPSHVLFEAGVKPVLSTAANAIDVIDLYSPDGGGHYIGVHAVKGAA